MRASISLILAISFFAVSCVNNPTSDIEPPKNGTLVQNQELASQIKASPDTVTIDNVKYSVEPHAWRNFMPSVDPPVTLNSNVTLIRADGIAIPGNIEIIQQYIIKEKLIWVPDDIDLIHNKSSPNKVHIVSREGPVWEVGSSVTVGLKIKDKKTGKVFLFSVSGVPIVKAY